MDKLATWLETHWLIRSLDSIAKLGIIIALGTWIYEISERDEQRVLAKKSTIYQAHQILALAHFRTSTAAGMAIKDLVDAGQNVSDMDLTELHIASVDLSNTNLSRVDLGESIIKNTHFINTNLESAELADVKFYDVDFKGANIKNAYLEGANLSGAKNLTTEMLNSAIICKNTVLPSYISNYNLVIKNNELEKLRNSYKNRNYIDHSILECKGQSES